MGFLFGIVKDIFSNKASIYFVGIVLVWGIAAGYNWLQKHDAEIVAKEEAKQTKIELERQQQVTKIYQDETARLMDNRDADEKAMSQLATHNKALDATLGEALKALNGETHDKDFPANCGRWANLKPPSNRQRVLAITMAQLRETPDLLSECDGDPIRCAVDGLRDNLIRESGRAPPQRGSDRQ